MTSSFLIAEVEKSCAMSWKLLLWKDSTSVRVQNMQNMVGEKKSIEIILCMCTFHLEE